MLNGDAETLKKRYESARARLITARLEVQLYGGHLLAMHPDRYTLADIGRMSVESGPSVPVQEDITVAEDERVGTTPPPPPAPTPPMSKEVVSSPQPWEKGLRMARETRKARNRASLLDEKLAKLDGDREETPEPSTGDPIVPWLYNRKHVNLYLSLIEEFKQLELFRPVDIQGRIAAFPAYSKLGHKTIRYWSTVYAKYLAEREGYVEVSFGTYGRADAAHWVTHTWSGGKRTLDKKVIEAIKQMSRFTPERVRQLLGREVDSSLGRAGSSGAFVYLDYLVKEGSVKKLSRGQYVALSPKALAEIAKYDEFRTQDLIYLVRDFEPALQSLSYSRSQSRVRDYIDHLLESGQFVRVVQGLYKTPQRIKDEQDIRTRGVRVIEEDDPMPHIIDGVVTYEKRPEEGYGRK